MVKRRKINAGNKLRKINNKSKQIATDNSKSASSSNTVKSNIIEGDNLLLKEKVKLNSKIKQKYKFLLKNLKLDGEKVLNSIKGVKLENEERNKKLKDEEFDNLYIYFLLKKKNSQVAKKNNNGKGLVTAEPDEIDEEDKLKLLKNKIIQLPFGVMNEKNGQKICLIFDNETLIKNTKNDLQNNIEDNTEEIERKSEKVLTQLSLEEKYENQLDIFDSKTFFPLLKDRKINLNSIYHSILIEEGLKTKLTQIINSKKETNSNLSFLTNNIIYYNKKKYGKKIYEYLKSLIISTISSTPLKLKSNRVAIVKVGNTGMTLKELYKNVKVTIYKVMSLILGTTSTVSKPSSLEVKCVVIKSENSLPYEVINGLTPEDLEYFEN